MFIFSILGEPYWMMMPFYVYEGALLDNIGGLAEPRYNGHSAGMPLMEWMLRFGSMVGQSRETLLFQARPIPADRSLLDSMWSFVCVSQSDRKPILYVIF